MGILDDAIREHLDLKRTHGARDSELQEIEDDAFGSDERPDPFDSGDLFRESGPPGQGGAPGTGSEEIPAPETPQGTGVPTDFPDLGNEDPTRLVEPQGSAAAPPAPPVEPPPPTAPSEPAFEHGAPAPPSETPAPPPPAEPPARPEPPPPTPSEPSPSAPPTPAPPPPSAPSPPGSGESESLADLMAEDEAERPAPPEPPARPEPPTPPPSEPSASAPPPTPAPPAAAPPEPDPNVERAPESEDLEASAEPEAPAMFDFETAEGEDQDETVPEAAPEPEIESEGDAEVEALEPEELEPGDEPGPAAAVPDPPPPPPERGSEPPGRARGRVHHATEEWTPPHPETGESHPIGRDEEPEGPPSGAPLRPEGAAPPQPESDSGPELYDFATDEGALDAGAEAAAESPPAPPADAEDDFEDLGPVTDESEVVDAPLAGDQDFDEDDDAPEDEQPAAREDSGEPKAPSQGESADDLLAASPEFIDEEGDDDEDLWFEKGPPKDFDFEDEDEG